MSEVVIAAEGIGKRYVIGHQAEKGRYRYMALRDVLAQKAGALWRSAKAMIQGSPIVYGDLSEEVWALKDVSFEIRQGETVGIIGRNGAGKSTLLKILSRITEPTRGRAEIHGRVGSLLEVGTGFHPELTGRENIYLNGAILGMKRAEIDRKFDEIVAFAEIEKFLDTPVKHYSSGMYVRLAFAVAAHLEPEILLVDEVLAVGDAAFQKKCLGKMGDVAKEGRTVLFVSHNMPAVQSLCRRVVLLQSGSVKMDNDPNAVISHYLSDGINTELAEVDLSQHSGRSHSQQLALRKAWMMNKDGVRTNSVMMGDTLIVSFQFQCSRPIVNPGFGFGVEDEYGRRIFSLNNYINSRESTNVRSISAGIASLHIPSLILLPGTYFISLSLVENQQEWIDFVEQALAFHVQPADTYGSGKIPERTQGVVFVPGQITFVPLEDV